MQAVTRVPAVTLVPGGRRLRVLAFIALGAAVAMVPWTVLLGLNLPARYVATHWSITWVGFDTALIAAFTTIAAAAWLHSRVLVPASIVTATLLACDAWFDLTTAQGRDIGLSLLTALGEIPIALGLAYLVTRHRRHAVNSGSDSHPTGVAGTAGVR